MGFLLVPIKIARSEATIKHPWSRRHNRVSFSAIMCSAILKAMRLMIGLSCGRSTFDLIVIIVPACVMAC
jgi:hypothetical protein